jgi:hypothetical protein
METTFINDKENFPVILDGYLYQSWGKKKKVDGSINYHCANYRTKDKCS